MIRDARVLDTRRTPDTELVVARERVLRELGQVVNQFLREGVGDLAVIDGPPGVGKTMVAELMCDQLAGDHLPLATEHINCWDTHSEFGVLAACLGAVGDPVRVDQRGTPLYSLRERLADATAETPLVVVLDEATQLDALSPIWALYEREQVFTVLVTNDRADLLRPASSAEASRLRSAKYATLEPYDHATLVTILERRAEHGLVRGAAPDEVLQAIASQADGDARQAIEALKHAAQAADAAGQDAITVDQVGEAIREAEAEIRQRNISQLKPTQRILLEELPPGEWLAMGEIHDRYCARAEEVTRQTLRRHLRKLDHYGHVDIKGSKRGRRYRVVPSAG